MHVTTLLISCLLIGALATLHVRAADPSPEDDVEIDVEPASGSAQTTREKIVSSDSRSEDDLAAGDVDALGDLVNDALVNPSKDAETTFIFAEPDVNMETRTIPSHEAIRVLIGVRNRSNKRSLFMDAVQASLRYPGDFNYAVQNFTLHPYRARQVAPQTEATLEYMFSIHESLAGRPFGLFIYMNYHDDSMRVYRNTIFNDTITIADNETGFDTETFFLYALGATLVVLIGIFAQQYFGKKGGGSSVGNYLRQASSRKTAYTSQRSTSVNKAYERGTSTGSNVDQEDSDWLPVSTYNFVNQSPKTSPKKSPRNRVRS